MSSFVERYQLLYEKDPNSKIFAPLAEAYRRMGLVDEAVDLAEKGVAQHPHFPSGRVALGKCYVQKGKFAEAAEQLKIASDLSPENLLAHQLLAECYTRLDKSIDALNAYKIVLFLNPNDTRVAEIVKKLEIEIYAGQSDEDANEIEEEYSMARVEKVAEPKTMDLDLEKELALLDSRYQRGDWGKVKEQLEELGHKYPNHPELLGRKQYLDEITNNNYALAEWLVPVAPDAKAAKIEKLKVLLERVESRRKNASWSL